MVFRDENKDFKQMKNIVFLICCKMNIEEIKEKTMKKIMKTLLAIAIVFGFAGAGFSKDYAERLMEKKYRKAIKVGCKKIETKSPKKAAWLGVLPGVGAFYTGEVGLGVVDLLFWPLSIAWDSPLAHKRAKKLNMEETILYCEESGKKL